MEASPFRDCRRRHELFHGVIDVEVPGHIPSGTIDFVKRSHSWLNEACAQAIHAKNHAEGSAEYESSRDKCAQVLNDAYHDYVAKLKIMISGLQKSDKQWWRLNRELINKKNKLSSIPPLKDSHGKWCLDNLAKANLLASTWAAKCMLPAPIEDQFVLRPSNRQQTFVAIRTRNMLNYLSRIDINTATGPDKI